MEEAARRTPIVVEAEIIGIGKPPHLWSESFIFSYQQVTYKVQRVIKGENIAEEIAVKHAVIEGSLASDKTKPQLSEQFFSVGKKLTLFLTGVNSRENTAKTKITEFISLDDECSLQLKEESRNESF